MITSTTGTEQNEMLNYKTKEEAQAKADQIIAEKDWEKGSLTASKAYKPLNGVDGWIILDAWNQPI